MPEVDKQIAMIGNKFRITPSTKFLANHLAKNYLQVLSVRLGRGRLTAQKKIKVGQTCLFIACKLRERDMHTPLISHMIPAGGFQLNNLMFRQQECDLALFYDWNFSMMTFYDYLEYFLTLGVLFEGDQHSHAENKTVVRNMKRSTREKMAQFIENRCLDLADQCRKRYVVAGTLQREMAYAIVSAARKEAGIINFDCSILRALYKVTRNFNKHFVTNLDKILKECPNNLKNMRFDTVFREYNSRGQEVKTGTKKAARINEAVKKNKQYYEMKQNERKAQQQAAITVRPASPRRTHKAREPDSKLMKLRRISRKRILGEEDRGDETRQLKQLTQVETQGYGASVLGIRDSNTTSNVDIIIGKDGTKKLISTQHSNHHHNNPTMTKAHAPHRVYSGGENYPKTTTVVHRT